MESSNFPLLLSVLGGGGATAGGGGGPGGGGGGPGILKLDQLEIKFVNRLVSKRAQY